MALFRKFFYRKPPDGLLEISERVYVFDCCFTTDVLEENEYKVYMEGIVAQLRDHFPDSSFMVFNFREGESQSQISAILSEYDMTVMDYPRQYEGCPLLALEVIHHFLRSSESWLLLAQQNILLMHCERGGWPVLAFMLAALLVYRKQYTGEQRTLDIIYKQAPRELLQLLSPLNPLPSQMRYLQYISRRNVSTEWPPLDRALTLDCVILRLIPDFDGKGGARPIFRIYGQDPLLTSDRTTKVLFSTPKKSNLVRIYKQADCELVKIDIDCHIQGDVVLECINIDEDLEREVMMFRVMFNTAFIRSNILMLNRDAVDILWDAKDRFPKDFRVEVLLSEMDAAMSRATLDFITAEDKEGLPIEAFAAVQEIFSVDWEDTKGDASLKVLQQLSLSNSFQDKFISFQDQLDVSSPKLEFDYLLQGSSPDKQQDRQQPDGTDKGSKNISPSSLEKDQTAFIEKTDFVTVNQNFQEKLHAASVPKVESHKMSKISSHDKPKDKVEHSIIDKKSKNSPNFSPEKAQIFPLGKTPPDLVINNENIKTHDLKFAIQRPNQIKVVSQRLPLSRSTPAFSSNSLQVSAMPASRYKSAPSMLGITALLEDDGPFESSHVIKTSSTSSHSISSNNVPQGSSAHLPPPPRSSSFENLREKIPIASPPPLPPHSPPPPPPPAAPTSLMSSATSIPTNAIAKVSDISLELPPPSLESSSTVCSILKEQLLPSSSQDSSYSAESLHLKVSPAVYAPPSPPPTPSTSAISSSKTSGSLGRVSSGLVNQPTLSNISDMPVPNSAHPPPSLPLPSINLSSPFPQSLKKVVDSASIPQLPPLSSQLGPSISSTAAKEPPSPPPLLPSLQLDHSISSEKKAPSPPPPPSLPLPSPSPPLSQLDSSISSAAEKAPSLPPPLPPPMPLLPSSQLDSCTSATKKAPLPPPPLPPLSRLDSSISSTANKALTPPTPPPLPSPSTPPLPSQLGPSISSTEAKRPSPPPPPPLPHPSEFGASISSAATKQPTPALSPQTLSTPSVGLGSKQSLAPPVPPPPPPSQAGHAISLAISKVPPPPPPPQPFSKPSSGLGSEMSVAPPVPPPPPSQVGPSKPLATTKEQLQPPIPPPPPSDDGPANYLAVTKAPVPPPPPPFSSKPSVGVNSKSSPAPPVPPPPMISISSKNTGTASSQLNSGAKVGAAEVVPPPPLNGMGTPGGKGRGLARVAGPRTSSTQSTSKRANLKPLHWVKVTRAMQGSLWAETQKSDELIKAPEFDMSELESLFSAAMPSGGRDSSEKSNSRSAAAKPDKVHLIDLRRANNCEIMLTKVKMPLQDLMSSVLTLDDSDLDIDQIENLIKFCPTKEEMDLLKGYSGDKESLGKCEQYFLELMRIPRVESKMRVFSFKIQFNTQVSDLRDNLNVVKSVAGEIRSSVKLKRIMQTILSLGNALNQGTARGSAIGFRLDSLLKLTDTRARNNKMTLMHYLCKVLAEKLPELLDFPKDLGSLEGASKIQLKILAEEMQAISKGLEKVEQELTTSENDGPVSQIFRKTLKDFLVGAEAEVRALASLYSNVGRNADALALYFGEDPARCPFEQVVSTLLNFVRMFVRAHEENCKQLELEKKKAQKEAENGKLKVNSNLKEQQSSIPSPTKREADAR